MNNFTDYNIVALSNGTFCFYSGPYVDDKSLKRTYKRFIVKTICDCQDEDWKTAIAQKKQRIPGGTELEVTQVLRNFYGIHIEVNYNGSLYYLDPRKLEYVKSYEVECYDK